MGGMIMGVLAALQVQVAWEPLQTPEELEGQEIRSVAVAPDESVWLAVAGRGLAHVVEGEVEWVSEADGLMSRGVADLLVDGSGRIWAVGLGGYSVRVGAEWRAADAMGPLRPPVIYSVSEDPRSGAIWMGARGGAGRLVDDEWRIMDEDDGLPHEVVHAAHSDASGDVWFACRTGLALRRGGSVQVFFPETNVRSILEAPDGMLWFGTSDGILGWDGRSWTWALRGRTIYPRLVASDGSIWAGSAASGVFRRERDGWRPVALPDRFVGAEVFDLDESSDRSIWVATSRGVVRLRVSRPPGN